MADPIFRTTDALRWGAGKGANLTPTEGDENIWALLQRILAIETGGATPVGIANIILEGNQITVILTDATELGPFTLPFATFTWANEWEPATAYALLDVVKVSGSGIYLVLHPHVSDGAFDPAASTTEGLTYQKIMDDNQAGMRGVDEIVDTAFMPALADNGRLKWFTHPDGCSVLLAPVADVPWPDGAMISFMQDTVSPVTVAGGDTSVTVQAPEGYASETGARRGIVSAIYMGDDRWILSGLLALLGT